MFFNLDYFGHLNKITIRVLLATHFFAELKKPWLVSLNGVQLNKKPSILLLLLNQWRVCCRMQIITPTLHKYVCKSHCVFWWVKVMHNSHPRRQIVNKPLISSNVALANFSLASCCCLFSCCCRAEGSGGGTVIR